MSIKHKAQKFGWPRFLTRTFLFVFLAFTITLEARPLRIAELEFKGAKVIDIIRVLAEDFSTNIIATPEAGKKQVTIFLKNITLEEAIKSICRISGLWYRRDPGANGTYRLMTKEQYSKDLVIGQDDSIKVFQLHNPNVIAIASAIEDLYGDRVQVSYGNTNALTGGNAGMGNVNTRNNSRFGGRRDNRGSFGQRGGGRFGQFGNSANAQTLQQTQQLPDNLTVEQLAELSETGRYIDDRKLATVSGLNKIIYVTVNIEHNLLVVKTSNQNILRAISELVKKLDRPKAQVMLEMKIVDIRVGEDFSSIFDIQLTNTGLTGSSLTPITLGGVAISGGGTLIYEYISKNIKANIELLEKNNRLNVVSSPMLVASNHKPAKLFVGEKRVMVKGYSIDTVDNLNTTRTIVTPETVVEDIGTTLEVTPHINEDGSIQILIKEEVSTLNKAATFIPVTNNTGNVVNLPIDTISTATLDGEVFARHGHTVAIGGLIRDSFSRSRSKVPYLADIPVLGNVFRSTTDKDEKSQMVLLITPYILDRETDKSGFDPTRKYRRHADDVGKLPEKSERQPDISDDVCGQYCAPQNLRQSDL